MDERIQKYEEKMKKTLGSLEAELTTIRAGRANPHILDKLTVDYYGSPTPIQQVANITVPEAHIWYILYHIFFICAILLRNFERKYCTKKHIIFYIKCKIQVVHFLFL